jgi:type IX secretion system PorP/SprF family membrane protein
MKLFFTFLFYLVTVLACQAQDFTFSQFYEKPLLRNPALAGVFEGDIRVSGAFRSQWGSVTVPFKTTALSIEYKLPFGNGNDFVTTAVQMSNDAAGDIQLKRTQVMPAVNFHKSLNEETDSYLSLAFMGGLAGNNFDPTRMKMADQWMNGEYNPSNSTRERFEQTGINYWDLSTGLSYSSNFGEDARYYIGAALFHVNKPRVAFNSTNDDVRLDQRYVFNAGFNKPVGDFGKITAFADYLRQGGSSQFLAGLLYGTDLVQYYDEEEPPVTIHFGMFYRKGDALIPVIRLDMKNISAGLSYDVNISKLSVASGYRGGLELTACYKGFLKTHSSTLDKVRCVRF